MAAVGEILFEGHLKLLLQEKLLPRFWSHFDDNKSVNDSLQDVSRGVSDLYDSLNYAKLMEEMKTLYPLELISSINNEWAVICKVLQLSIGAWLPKGGVVFKVTESLVRESLVTYESARKGGEEEDMEEDMETETHTNGFSFWNEFQSLTERLSALGLRDQFLSHSTVLAIENKVRDHVTERCADIFDENLLNVTLDELQTLLNGWLTAIYGEVSKEWSGRILHHIYSCYGGLRIKELFDIIVDFPDSELALTDLRECLNHVDMREELMESLTEVYESRLLHHGANTSDIITQYISSVRSLKLLDPTGVVLERVCEPVKAYLRTRNDTVTCIMASLIDDSNNDLSEELAKGETVLLDLSDEYEDPDQDFEAWEPDPVDADPLKSSKSRQTSDIISLLVHIYGTQEFFVNEYRNLLSDRLLQSLDYDVTRELRNLELLKLRFGEGNLHYCEVMIKDITDSRRVNGLIADKLSSHQQSSGGGVEGETGVEDVAINSFILSHIFWPCFRIETMKMPPFIEKKLSDYNKRFQEIKGMRELKWCHDLGQVQLELEVNGQVLNYQVSPAKASVIWQFQNRSSWSVEDLSIELDSQPSVVRRHLLYWAGQGILHEEREGEVFKLIEREAMDDKYREGGMFEEESALTSKIDQKENDLQIVWSYVTAMLTNLGPMPLDRIHNMLSIFMLQGPAGGGGGGGGQTGSGITLSELKSHLDKKIKTQELSCTSGIYQLNKSN